MLSHILGTNTGHMVAHGVQDIRVVLHGDVILSELHSGLSMSHSIGSHNESANADTSRTVEGYA